MPHRTAVAEIGDEFGMVEALRRFAPAARTWA
jgi:hypothetical protein